MASLANITFELRTVSKIAGITLAIIFFIFLGVRGIFFLKNVFFPPPPTPAEQKFGQLPPITFPEGRIQASYVLDTVDGDFPNLPSQIEVYKIDDIEPNLIALQQARDAVKGNRFTVAETKITDTIFRWSSESGETITYDIYTNNFSIDSDFLYKGEDFVIGSFLLSRDNLLKELEDLLSSLRVNMEDVDIEKSIVRYYRINSGKLSQVESQSDSQIARIDLFQKNISNRTILYPVYEGSTMSFFAGETERGLQFKKADFYHYTFDSDTSSTYPIITAKEAFEKLVNGEGLLLTDLEIRPETKLTIKEIGIAYYLGKEDIGFLEPVIVFAGNDFYALVPALRSN